MKRILFTTVSLGALALVSPALGADLPTYTKAPVAPTYDWSGFYVGVFGGGGFGNNNVNNAFGSLGLANYTANFASQGGMGGGEIGYNAQSGVLVIGIEAQGFWSGIKGSDATGFNSGLYPGVTGIDANKLQWGGSLVARGGLTVDRLMLFFTGGWAFGDIQHTDTNVTSVLAPVGAVDRFTAHGNGLTAGGGLAFAITNNLIGKIEYKYYSFNTYSSHGTPFTVNGQLPYTVESTYSTVTVGLDYKFGGPVVAKY
jgi:outer membrane immunogenic protein